MIANPSYQMLVVNDNADLKVGLSALKTLALGQLCLINEDNPSSTSVGTLKRFSLYQKAKNDKGKEIMIKHGGPLPILVDSIQRKSFKAAAEGVPQYWKLTMDSAFESCCENYAIRFGLYNDAIQKTMFPSELVENFSVENECCGRGCGNNDGYNGMEILFRIWADVMKHNEEQENYITAAILNSSHKVIADAKGNSGYTYTDTNSHSHTVTINTSDMRDGYVKYVDTDTTASPNTSIEGKMKVSDFVSTLVTKLSISGNVDLVFAIAAEDENQYGQMNFKYDVIRNTRARVTLNGGFECAEGVLISNNDTSTSAASIYFPGDSDDVGDTVSSAVSAFAYSIGQKYDVREMELADSLHTLNSPYTLSDITLSENGIDFRATADSYWMLSIEYNQPSDGVTRVEHHPWGTTIAIKTQTYSPKDNWNAFLSALNSAWVSSNNWVSE